MNTDSSFHDFDARSSGELSRLEEHQTAADYTELSDEEQRDRLYLERRVERAFYEAGSALRELRDRRLYRSSHGTFEAYCRDRFTFSRQAANYLIAGAEVFENLTTIGCQNEEDNLETIAVLPTSERQVRPLASLDPDEQREAWQQSVVEAGGRVPSSRIVKNIVQRIRERTPVSNSYRAGEVCRIVAGDNVELRGKGGCWCIVIQVHDWSCTVRTWNGKYQVRIEHLKPYDYSLLERRKMKELGNRMTQLYETESLDEAALWVLKGLEKLNRPFLTPLEEKLLALLEKEYELINQV